MENSSSSSESYDSYEKHRHNTVDTVVEYMKKMRGLDVIDVLGRGTYGDVLLFQDSTTKAEKAIKIVLEEHSSEVETSTWPSLLHQSILPTEEPIEMEDGTIIFISPVMFKGLDSLLSDEAVLTYTDCIQVLKTWLKEALLGVQYMHEHGYCHMDLKLDNILVGYDGHACVADFTFLNKNDRLLSIHDMGLPRQYQPPEVFKPECRNSINGIAVDMWSFGIVIVEAFSNQHLLKSVDYFNDWHGVMEPKLKSVLENPTFESLAKLAFRKHIFMEGELLNTLIVCNLLLQEDTTMRAIASKILGHTFFEEVEDFKIVMSDIYIGKDFGSRKPIDNNVEKNSVLRSPLTEISSLSKITSLSEIISFSEISSLSEVNDNTKEQRNKIKVGNTDVVDEETTEGSAYKQLICGEFPNITESFGDIPRASESLLHSSVPKGRRVHLENGFHSKSKKVIRNNFGRNVITKQKKTKMNRKALKQILKNVFMKKLVRDVCCGDLASIRYINQIVTKGVPSKKIQEESGKPSEDTKDKENLLSLSVFQHDEDISDQSVHEVFNLSSGEIDRCINQIVTNGVLSKQIQEESGKSSEDTKDTENLLSLQVFRHDEHTSDQSACKVFNLSSGEVDETFACELAEEIPPDIKIAVDNEYSQITNFNGTKSLSSDTSPKSMKRRKSLKSWFRKKFTKCIRSLFCCCCNEP